MDNGEQFVMMTGIYWMPSTYVFAECIIFKLSLLFTVLYAINLDLVMLSGITQVVILEVETHPCPFGWVMYCALPETVTCLSVVMVAGETITVDIMKMLVLRAMEQVCIIMYKSHTT